jgi:hypothetical protein
MNTNTLLALVVGGVVVYLIMQKKGDKQQNVPTCKENEVLKKSQPNCLVAPCPTLYSCELKKSI